MQNLFNNLKTTVNGTQPLAVGKEPFRVKFGMTGDFPCEKEVLQVLQVLVKKETTIKI